MLTLLRPRFASVCLAALVAGAACSPSPASAPPNGPPAPPPPKLLAELQGIAVTATYPKGFDRLTAEQRALAYHLTAAGLAGNALYTGQRSRFGRPAQLAVRQILAATPTKLDPATRKELLEYRRLLRVHAGLHDRATGEKYAPPMTRAEFEKAARDAKVAAPDDLLAAMFDPHVQPVTINKTPGPGKDPIAESAADHYEGLTSADLHQYREAHPLNGRLMKQNGAIVEQVYRAGDGETPSGLGAAELRRVIEHLEAAMRLAPPAQKEALRHLVNYFATGEPEEFRKHDIAWVAHEFPVDYTLGFIEVTLDVRERKGSFEGFVAISDPERGAKLRALAQSAAYFEEKLPWPDELKRNVFRTPVAEVVTVLGAAGEAGFFTLRGLNLPNDADFRATYGTKSFMMASTEDARVLVAAKLVDEFVPAESRAEVKRCFAALRFVGVALHEVTGHGSGKVKADLAGTPEALLAPYFSAMEEGRANLVVHYLSGDPKTVELGLLPDAGCAKVAPAWYDAAVLASLRSIPKGDRIEESHMQGDFVRLGVFLEKGVIVPEERDGKLFLVTKDPEAWRRAAGELLVEHQRIRATGDKAALTRLVEKYATHVNAAWRDQVVSRYESLNLPRAIITVPPVLTPIRDAKGTVVDAKAEQVGSLDAYLDVIERAEDGHY
ncbi:dipeptidyl-peptidase 3 family protein [Pendulispora albinea]|uniref:Dipeptidyl peptidase 3 n=1 Tax=Pendulispora albinea TaxID=2741071 RepID=A0ABZ2LWN6_9BACT